jgi:hypothetical protein
MGVFYRVNSERHHFVKAQQALYSCFNWSYISNRLLDYDETNVNILRILYFTIPKMKKKCSK